MKRYTLVGLVAMIFTLGVLLSLLAAGTFAQSGAKPIGNDPIVAPENPPPSWQSKVGLRRQDSVRAASGGREPSVDARQIQDGSQRAYPTG